MQLHLPLYCWNSLLIAVCCLQGAKSGWYDGAGIAFAIILVVLVTGKRMSNFLGAILAVLLGPQRVLLVTVCGVVIWRPRFVCAGRCQHD